MFEIKNVQNQIYNKTGIWAKQENPEYIVIHHDGVVFNGNTEAQEIERINSDAKWYQRQWFAYSAPYHFVIGRADTNYIYQVVSIDESTAHCSNYSINRNSLALTFLGNYEEQKLTEKQIDKANWFITSYIKPKMKFKELTYHKKTSNGGTVCPGKNVIPLILDGTFENNNIDMEQIKQLEQKVRDMEKSLAEVILNSASIPNYLQAGLIKQEDLDFFSKTSDNLGVRNEFFRGLLKRDINEQEKIDYSQLDLITVFRNIVNSDEYKKINRKV